MHVSSGRRLYGFLLALTTTLLWGVLPIMLKQVLQVMDPYTVTWYRLLSAGLVLFCWLAAKRRLPSIMALSRHIAHKTVEVFSKLTDFVVTLRLKTLSKVALT